MSNRGFPTLVRYGSIIPALLLAALLRLGLDPYFGDYAPFVTFFGASMLVAWYGGPGPALLALPIGALIAAYLFIPPIGSIWPEDAAQWSAIALYLIINVGVILLIGFLKHTKAAAEINDRHFRRLLDAGNIGIALVDEKGGVEYANPALRRLVGYTDDEIKAGQLRWDRITPPEFAHVTTRIIDHIEKSGGEVIHYEPYEKEYFTKDKRRIPVLVSVVPFEKRADGVRTGAAFVMDLTRVKQAERELRVNQVRMHIAAETAGFGSFDFDLESGEEFWSPEIKKLFGLSPDASVELDKDRLPICFHPDDRECILRLIQAAKDPNGPGDMKMEHRILRPDGKDLWVLNRSKIFFTGEGDSRRAVRHVGALIDIDERKHLEEALRANETHLKRAITELEQFAYVASHDLKAPLRAVHGLSSWIEEEASPCLSRDGHRHMELLRGRVTRMDQLIDALLEYSRAGGQVKELETIAVTDFIERIISTVEHPVEFQFEIAPDLPTLTTDTLHLRQVFINLVDNAIRYHDRPDGRVTISARDLGESWEFTVADDGPGIPLVFQERIFNLFERDLVATKSSGIGVGLPLVKKVVENLGGDIRLESLPGKGTKIRFTWPKKIPINSMN